MLHDYITKHGTKNMKFPAFALWYDDQRENMLDEYVLGSSITFLTRTAHD
jgi:hypothetical protein